MITEFVGRTSEIDLIKRLLLTVKEGSSPAYLTTTGPGGIGKTKLLLQAKQLAEALQYSTTSVIDLSSTISKSKLNLLRQIVESEAIERAFFSQFYNDLAKYEAAQDLEKNTRYEILAKTFIKCCNNYSKVKPLLILLDTYEAVQKNGMSNLVSELIAGCEGRILFLLAGRQPIILPEIKKDIPTIELEPFSVSEAIQLAKSLYEKKNISFDLDSEILSVLITKSQGRPILLTLAIEWILETGQPEELVSAPVDDFEAILVEYLRRLEDQESQIILFMATLDRRFSSRIAHVVTEWPDVDDVCQSLTRFSFIKHRKDNLEDVYILHDEMLRLINKHIGFPAEFKNKIRKKVVERFYQDQIIISKDYYYHQTLLAESLYYKFYYDEATALVQLDNEIQQSLANYEFDLANLLLNTLDTSDLSRHSRDSINFYRAELLLKQYRPLEAKQILDDLRERLEIDEHPDYSCRVLAGIASYIINPCTSVQADYFDAIPIWQECLRICNQYNLVQYKGEVFYQLGNTQLLVGQNQKALENFNLALDIAEQIEDYHLKANILDEIGKLYRLEQNLNEAQKPIEASIETRKKINDQKNFGKSFYYLGNLYRDMNRFEEALGYYELAKTSLQEIGDTYALCELYCDWSWYYVLAENYDEAERYNRICLDIAQEKEFGREISEVLHIFYHLEIERGNYDVAIDYVKQAYSACKKYMNIYMNFDCLMHIAQDAYKKGQPYVIEEALEEMRQIEDRGCGIRVFTGRTLNVYGDYLFDKGQFDDALRFWKEGFHIIAIHGNSRTNIELFEDHINARSEKIYKVLLALGEKMILDLRKEWTNEILNKGYNFPQITEICDKALLELISSDNT